MNLKIQNLITKIIYVAIFLIIHFSCEYEEYERSEESKPLAECVNGHAKFELNGVSYEYDCSGYDLIGYVSLEEMDASSGNDCWGWTDSSSGKEYVLMGLDNGTAFIDISEPTQPRYLGKLPTQTIPTVWRDIKVYKDHAFIVADFNSNIPENDKNHGIQVFDLNILGGISKPTNFSHDFLYMEHGQAHNIAINEKSGFAYSVGTNTFGGGLHVIDISDPKNPTFSVGYQSEGYTHDAQVVNYKGPDVDYQGKEIFIGSNGVHSDDDKQDDDKVVIIDVSDKKNIQTIASFDYPNIGYTHQAWLTDDHRYLFVGDELDEILGKVTNTRILIFDLSDLDNPRLHQEFFYETDAIDHNGYVVGSKYYQANYSSGLRVIDILNIDEKLISETGYFDTYNENKTDKSSLDNEFNLSSFDPDHGDPAKGRLAEWKGAWSVYPFFKSENIIISDINSGLFIVRKSSF